MLLSVGDYNNTVLPAVAGSPAPAPAPAPGPAPGPSPSPSPSPSPAPAPAPAPISPRTCGSTAGPGVGGLSLFGQASYSNVPGAANASGTMSLDPGEISFNNPNLTASSTTGSLRATFWAVAGTYNGGTISGAIVARYNIQFTDGTNQLRNFQSSNLVAQSLTANTPSRGSYCMVVTLDEYAPASCPGSSDGYCVVDWLQFPNSAQFQ